MLDYQRIVDDVRSALFNNGQDGDDFLQAAAADYSLAIDEVNERLRHCGGLLRKGLRSESLQLCEIEPNLLERRGNSRFSPNENRSMTCLRCMGWGIRQSCCWTWRPT